MVLKRVPLSPDISARGIKGLYALTPDSTDTDDLQRCVRLALAGGVQVLQYRNKLADAGLRLSQAQTLRTLTRELGVTFIVNDDAQLAATVDADGVHLGATDGDIKTARALLGNSWANSLSCSRLTGMACLSTIHSTPSEQGGVVSEPMNW